MNLSIRAEGVTQSCCWSGQSWGAGWRVTPSQWSRGPKPLVAGRLGSLWLWQSLSFANLREQCAPLPGGREERRQPRALEERRQHPRAGDQVPRASTWLSKRSSSSSWTWSSTWLKTWLTTWPSTWLSAWLPTWSSTRSSYRDLNLFFCDRQLSYTEVANFTCRAENEVKIISSTQIWTQITLDIKLTAEN